MSPSHPAHRRWLRLWLAPVAVVVAVVSTWAIVRSGGQGNEKGAAPDDAGVVHVHSLGINPKNNTLYAATHTGLFRIPQNGKAERVADRHQDTMGFTVVGPDHFLGSGHPDLREVREKRLPPLLGLLESTNAGRTWRSLSLLGKADFHALRAAHGRIYGYDSTSATFMVSPEGKTWDMRAKLPIRDFVVSSSNPEIILATTETGLQRSTDGGHSWEPLNAPPLVLLTWERPEQLWGLGRSGGVYISADAGESWQQLGALAGPPAAFLAAGSVLYAAVHDGAIYQSEDGGRSWQLRYRDPNQ